MDVVYILLTCILLAVGVLGCILPGLPGPPLSYLALLLLQWAWRPFGTLFLVVWGVVTALAVVLDYWLPVWTAKKFGATRQGVIGGLAGMVLGAFFTPIGMVAGLVLGAVLGDLVAGRSHAQAARSGLASAFGTLVSIGLKLAVSVAIAFYAVRAVLQHLF